jgi:hypothetical protein
VPDLDRYLTDRAVQDAKRKVSAPFVTLDQSGDVVGYYTLSAYSVCLTDPPPALAKKLPKYPVLPATLLGRLAISQERQGQKLGRLVLMDALHRSWKNTVEVASIGVFAEPYDASALGSISIMNL